MAETVLEKAEKVLAELRERAGKLRRVHEENLELMLRDAEKLLEQGDVRDAAEKAYAAYKSLLGLLAAANVDKLEEMLREKIAREPNKGLREARWWVEKGLEVPSRAVGPLALLLSKLLGDEEVALAADHAILLHKWFYGGDELVEGMTREKAEHTIKYLLKVVKAKKSWHLNR